MFKLLGTVLALLLLASIAIADELPRVELYGGYSYSRLEDVNLYAGWNAGFTYYFSRFAGVTADFSGYYKDWEDIVDFNQHTFLFGPQFAYREDARIKPFARFLVGFTHGDISILDDLIYGSDNAFCIGGGGGIDLTVNDVLAIRLIQYDYHRIMGGYDWNQHRLAAGVVIQLARPYRHVAAPGAGSRYPSSVSTVPAAPIQYPPAPVYQGEMVPVSVSSEPDGASVFVNERFVGMTPVIVQLPQQKVRVRLFLFGFRDWLQEVDINKSNTSIHVILKK